MTSDIEENWKKGRGNPRGRHSQFIKERIKGLLGDLNIKENGLLDNPSLVDDLDKVVSMGIDDSLTYEYEIDHEKIEWKKEENKPISELVLKGNR